VHCSRGLSDIHSVSQTEDPTFSRFLAAKKERQISRSPVLYIRPERLPSQAYADYRKQAVEIPVTGFARVDAPIRRAEEKIGLVTKTDFGIGIFERQARKTSDLRHHHTSATRVIGCGGILIKHLSLSWSSKQAGRMILRGPDRSVRLSSAMKLLNPYKKAADCSAALWSIPLQLSF
jgi:hypothetical protein